MGNLVFLLLLSVNSQADDESWMGKQFIPRFGVKFMSGTTEVPWSRFDFPLTVTEVQGQWLRVGPGFIRKSDVVRLEDAAAYFTEYLRQNPANASAYNNRGLVWQAKGELDNALKDYTEAIRIDPKSRFAYIGRGNVWSDKGELDNALKDYTEAIRINPKDYRAYNARAWLLATSNQDQLRDGPRAVADATTACELSEWKAAYAVGALAAAYAETGDFVKAIEFQELANGLYTSEKDQALGRERLEGYRNQRPHRE